MSGPRSPDGPPGGHSDLGPELRQLAQAILDRIDPTVRAAAALAAARSGAGPGKCQQVWCPVCALAALVTGEEHPLLTLVGEHSVALLTVIRMVIDGGAVAPEPPQDPEPGGSPSSDEPDTTAAPAGRYQPITIIVEE